jgi:thiol-disulfide isomerase/thioredoxin
MKMRISAPVIALLFVFASCTGSGTSELSNTHKTLVEGYEFSDWHGNPVAVSDYEGSLVVLDFWESWCGPCLSAFPGFQQALDEFPEDLVVIAATVGWQEGRDEALEFKEEMDYDFIYVDGSELASELGFRGIPFKIILDREGKVETVQTGSSGADREYELLVEKINSL